MMITCFLEDQLEQIELQLNRLIPTVREGPHASLFEAARYALLNGGKRLRPLLTLATTQTFGGELALALTPACAVEMVHTYSLIHDDLPCMDNDDYRRGQLTVHRKYSEGHAVLTGDFLLTFAFEVLSTDPLLPAKKKSELIATLARQSGGSGMIGGQAMDLAFEGQQISLDSLQQLHRHKTAALLTASIEFGAIIANADNFHLHHLRQFGENIGMAFQIIDDILDVTESQIKHGKAMGSDMRNEKMTYVSLLGIEKAHEYALNYYTQSVKALRCLSIDTSLLINLADLIMQRKH